jgi:hypothetical protein
VEQKLSKIIKGKEEGEGDNLIQEKLHNWTSLEDKWLAYKKHLLQVITYENNLPHAHNTNSFDLIVHLPNLPNICVLLVLSVRWWMFHILLHSKVKRLKITLCCLFISDLIHDSFPLLNPQTCQTNMSNCLLLKSQGIGKMRICPKTHICYNMGVSLRSNLDIKPY